MKNELFLKLDIQYFAQTKASDLVNPEVMAVALSGKLENAIKFRKYADVDNELVGRPGDTITRPKYAYIGPAEDLQEGIAMDTAKLSMTTTTVTIKEAGRAVEITEAAILTNVGGTVAEAERQLSLAMADKVEIDYIAELEKAPLFVANAPTSAANILSAISLLNAEGDLNVVLFINPTDYTALVQSLFTAGGDIAQRALSTGQVSELVGVKAIERTRRVAQGKGYLQVYDMGEEGQSEDPSSAVEIVLKRDVAVNRDGDILARTVTIASNTYYTVNLKNDAAVVRFGGTAPKVDVTGVTLAPETATAAAGTAGSEQFTATVAPANATTKTVTYTIKDSGGDDEAGLTVSTTGLVEWDETVAAGTYTLTATTTDGGKTDTATVTLTPAG